MCKIASHVLVSTPDIVFCFKSIHSRFFKLKASISPVHYVVNGIHIRKARALPVLAASCHFFIACVLPPDVPNINRYTVHGAPMVKECFHVDWNEVG